MHLAVRDLSIAFGPVKAVRSVSLTVADGEIVGIFGPNGSGKTTFLKAVAGLLPVRSGRIVVRGEDVTSLPAHQRAARGVHYVSDRARVALRMTVRENLDVGGYRRRRAALASARENVFRLFPVLREKARSPAGILSGGERQMLVLGRALMGRASLLLFDEPFLGLSRDARERILRVVDEELRGRATILLAEHDLEGTVRILSRCFVFRRGEVVHEANRDDVAGEDRMRAALLRCFGDDAGRARREDQEER